MVLGTGKLAGPVGWPHAPLAGGNLSTGTAKTKRPRRCLSRERSWRLDAASDLMVAANDSPRRAQLAEDFS
jgi:hypothetical protein